MQIWNNLKLIIFLAVISMCSIVVMLIVGGIYDVIFMFFFFTPIGVGCYRACLLHCRK